MEVCWLAAIFLALDSLAPADQPPLALAAWLYPAAYFLFRWDRLRTWPFRRELAAGLAGGSLALVLTVKVLLLADLSFLDPAWPLEGLARASVSKLILKRLLFILIGGGFAWARGWILAGRRVNLKGLLTGFQVGLVVLLVTMFLASQGPVSIPAAWALIMAFFALGLTGLWLARSLEMARVEGLIAPRPWSVIVTATVGLVLLLGFLVFALVDRDLLNLLLQPLAWLWRLFIRLIDFLVSLLPKPGQLERLPEMGQAIPRAAPEEHNPLLDFRWVRIVAHIFFTVSWVCLVAGVLFRGLTDLLRWLRRRWDQTPGLALEASDYRLRDDLRALLGWLKGLLVRLWRRVLKWRRPGPAAGGEASSVRDVYRRLLDWAAARGLTRTGQETPYEYLERLSLALPEGAEDFGLITESYVRVRYGLHRPDPATMNLVRESWRRIKARPRNRSDKRARG